MNIVCIIKEEINKILNEGISNIVYHFTYIFSLINILQTNKFATSSNLGSSADASKDRGNFFFFSTQRSKGTAGYGNHHGNVSIVLDGQKLNQNFKGFAIDYWNWSKKRSDYDNLSSYRDALLSSELEDRIVTNKPFIENANKYIKEIHVFINPDQTDKKDINELVNLTSKYNIPIFFYTNNNSFKLQNKIKSIPPAQIEALENLERYKSSSTSIRYFESIVPYILLKNNKLKVLDNIQNLLKNYLKTIFYSDGVTDRSNQYDEIMDKINSKINRLNSSWGRLYDDDEYRSLSADIHNQRGNPDPYYRALLKILVDDIRNVGAKNLKEYMQIKTKIN